MTTYRLLMIRHTLFFVPVFIYFGFAIPACRFHLGQYYYCESAAWPDKTITVSNTQKTTVSYWIKFFLNFNTTSFKYELSFYVCVCVCDGVFSFNSCFTRQLRKNLVIIVLHVMFFLLFSFKIHLAYIPFHRFLFIVMFLLTAMMLHV